MTGSLGIAIGITWWSAKHAFPLMVWMAAVVVYLIIAVCSTLRKYAKENHILNETLRINRTPKLSIEYTEAKPYISTIKRLGVEERIIRIGVKNNSLSKASKVRVQFETCTPDSDAILLKHDLTPTGIVAPITIGPDQAQLFDVLVSDGNTARAAYNTSGPDENICEQEYEFEISANCDESTPTKSTFRLDVGQNGFSAMRRIK